MSAVAHFFVAVSGSFIHERMAQLFIDIYTYSMIYTIYRDMINILFLGKADDYQAYLNNMYSPTDEHSK